MSEERASFLTPEEKEIADAFHQDGYIIFPVEQRDGLDRIRDAVVAMAHAALGQSGASEDPDFLDNVHRRLDVAQLNNFRLQVFREMNALDWFRPSYFSLARSMLTSVVGNELAMQRRINLSIQLPQDTSSLLPLHSDVWSGDSPYEVVLWLPLVDCFDTKSMYILPPADTADFLKEMHGFQRAGVKAATDAYEEKLCFLTVPYGHALLFNQCLPHGNMVNQESTTRWSFNCRFKGVFSPYADKRLGEFFEPITLRPASRAALAYQLPSGFDEADGC